MRKDKIVERTQREDFLLACSFMECGPRCPQYGHSVRLDNPEHYHAPSYAESRVRALHAVLALRAGASDLVGATSLAELFSQLVSFGDSYRSDFTDSTTFYQLISIKGQLARFMARRLSAIKQEREVNAWAEGFRTGARFVREVQYQF